MNCVFSRADCMAPPEIIATSRDGCTNTCMLVDADFFEAVFVTVAVSVYMMEVCNENGGSKYFDGSREDEVIDSCESLEAVVMLHENCKNCVDVDPSQLAVKAFVATENGVDLVCVSTWGPTIVIVGTIKFKMITVAMFWPQ